MTLLNGLLALGALAFSVPLIIHLFFRSKFRVVPWGAMHLIDSVMKVNRRRIELLNLLLLLMRCAIPILLAFCLARPVLTGFQSLPGDAPQTVVIAIDDSRSMAIAGSDAMTPIQRASAAVRGVLDSLTRRDEVMLIRSSRLEEVPGAMGASEAANRVAKMEAVGGPTGLGRLVRAASMATDNASNAERRMIVVSDFQSHLVDDSAVQTLEQWGRVQSDKSVTPAISFLDVGDPADEVAENLSVEIVSLDSAAVVAGRDAEYSARIRNHGQSARGDVRFAWTIDGKPMRPQAISVAARSAATTRLKHSIDDAGVHVIGVAIEHSDALADDNQRLIGVEVIDEIDVLIVDGEPSNKPLEGEADFVSIALSPFAFGGQDQPDAVRTRVVNAWDAPARLAKQRCEVLILAGVVRPSEELKHAIADFVAAGGSLVVFDHEKLDAKSYSQPWTTSSGEGPSLNMPARMGEFQTLQKDASVSSFPIGRHNAAYSPWAMLGNDGASLFNDVTVTGYRKLSIAEPVEDESDAQSAETQTKKTTTLLSMAGGDPLIVMAEASRDGSANRTGRVVQFAVPADAEHTTFPLRAVYLPMLQQLILDLAGSRNQTTFDVGEPVSLEPSRVFSSLDRDAVAWDEFDYRVTPPDGNERTMAWSGAGQSSPPALLLGDTHQPGVYRFTASDAQGQQTFQSARVVEVPAVESESRFVDNDRLNQVAELVNASVYTSGDELISDDTTRRFGREIWRWLLLALLVVMIGELWLQQRLGSRSRATPEPVTPSLETAS